MYDTIGILIFETNLLGKKSQIHCFHDSEAINSLFDTLPLIAVLQQVSTLHSLKSKGDIKQYM